MLHELDMFGNCTVMPGRFTVMPGRFTVIPGRFMAMPGRVTVMPGRFTVMPAKAGIQTPAAKQLIQASYLRRQVPKTIPPVHPANTAANGYPPPDPQNLDYRLRGNDYR